MRIIKLILLLGLSFQAFSQTKDFAKYVNPFVGTDGHGHTFPGATLPFGMVQLSPDTRIDGSWDGCSGYHYSDSIIYGFTHNHLSGTGVSDYGDILLMPVTGEPSFDNKKYSAKFDHKNEKAEAGFYSVKFYNGISAELTATTRCGFHKYNFPAGKASVILDLTHRDELLEGNIQIVDNKTIAVKRRSKAWATNQHTYAFIVFSKPFKYQFNSDKTKAILSFSIKPNEDLLVKTGISFVDEVGAKKNLEAEISGFDFQKVKNEARQAWNKELNKIEINDKSEEKLRTFYTALYHTMIHPNIATDVDQRYRGMDDKIHKAEGYDHYTVFSLWDTFRAAHPLYTIIDKKRTLDFIKTFLSQYQQGGRLPVWELAANETDCMIGYHSVSVISDAAAKGIKDFDLHLALDAMKKSATWDHLGLPQYIDHGHLTIEDEHESVSKTLEYAYDDWCIAQFAKMLGRQEDYLEFMKRSQYWKNLLDPETKLMRPKKNGSWLSPFDPSEVNNHFTEGNSWQYSFFVPHDIYGMIEMMGGAAAFEKKLDELFSVSSQTTGRTQVDITGLIGQYAHGNEPSHHMAYLYNYIGKPQKTQQRVNQIMNEFYSSKPDGLIGNEDCGQMSAWYVLSTLGMYQVAPGTTEFILGSPYVDQAIIHLENGNKFKITAENANNGNCFSNAINFNGKLLENASYIDYNQIMNGGELAFVCSEISSIDYTKDLPPATKKEAAIVTVPYFINSSRTFKDTLHVKVQPSYGNHTVRYTTDGTKPGRTSNVFSNQIIIDKTTTIKAISISDSGEESHVVTAMFNKVPTDVKVKLLSTYNRQYSAGGPEGLTDGIRGDANWRKGEWQGYQDTDFEAILEFDNAKEIKKISAGFLQDTRSWILMPTKVEFFSSENGIDFKSLGIIENKVSDKDYEVQIQDLSLMLKAPLQSRFIKVKAINYGTLPEWHQGSGYQAFIFVDEIMVE
jgi:predicted alpha-1,2-mannosidase